MRIDLEPNRKDMGKVLLSGMVGDEDQSESKGDGCSWRADRLQNVHEKAEF